MFRTLLSLVSIITLTALLAGCSADPAADSSAADPAARPATLATVDLSEGPAFPLPAHLEHADLAAGKVPFQQIFDAGRDLFHTAYNGLDGVGIAVLPNGTPVHRFAASPPGASLLAPSSQSCGGCHNLPFPGAAGLSQTHIAQDGDLDGAGPFNERSTTSVFGDGILQLLAQEITEELQAARAEAATSAMESPGEAVTADLLSKGVSFGSLTATADTSGNVSFDLSGIEGVDPDLVVRPIGWKGSVTTIRTLVTAAASIAMGMQAEEFVWRNPGGEENPDLDGDGVERELSVGDVTAMTLYTAGQETPQELDQLVARGLVAAPSDADAARVERGRSTFTQIGCASCHLPEMPLHDTVFEEPTIRGNGNFYDKFLAERDPAYDPEKPVSFDLLSQAQEPRLAAAAGGGATARLYGDLKRHAMGRHLSEPGGPTPSLAPEIAPAMHEGGPIFVAPDVFLTAELWGVGNTGPWLHDGRAGTLREAVVLHGEDDPPAPGAAGRSEAQESRDAFVALSSDDQEALIAFLLSLRTFALTDEA